MSDEITVNALLTIDKENQEVFFNIANKTFDQTTQLSFRQIAVLTTTERQLTMGDVSAAGWFMFRNLDETNIIQLGILDGTFKPVIDLLPGEFGMGHLSIDTGELYAKSKSGTASLDYWILNQ